MNKVMQYRTIYKERKYKSVGYFQYEETYWNMFLNNEFISITLKKSKMDM